MMWCRHEDEAMTFLTQSIVDIADQNLVPERPEDTVTLGGGGKNAAKPKGPEKEVCSGCKPTN